MYRCPKIIMKTSVEKIVPQISDDMLRKMEAAAKSVIEKLKGESQNE